MKPEEKKVINYQVNEIHQETLENKMKVRDILVKAKFDPSKYALVRSNNPNKKLEYDNYENIHEGEEFLAVSTAPTPVSR